MFFMGTYTPKLDDKGRLFLPAKFRDQLAEGLVVTRGQERCLTVWPTAAFEEVARRAQASAGHRARRPATTPASSSPAPTDEKPDKQGRITIPPMLREYAALARTWSSSASMNRVEIWDPAALAGVLGGAGGGVRRPERRSLPRSLSTTSTHQHDQQHRQQNSGSHGRGLAPAPCRHLGHLPRLQRSTSHAIADRGAGRDLVRRIRSTHQHRSQRTSSVGSRP